MVLLAAVAWLGQAAGQEANFTANANLSYDNPAPDLASGQTPPLVLGSDLGLELKGPLVLPMKPRALKTVPGSFLKLLNPLAPVAPKAERATKGKLGSQAWASVMGYSPGRSAFPDPLSHEPTLGLVSLEFR